MELDVGLRNYGELLRGHRWAAVVSGATNGVAIRTYSRLFLDDLADVVRTTQPLMKSRGIVIPVWCEERSRKSAGMLAPTPEPDGVTAQQSTALSSWRTQELSDECGRTIEIRDGYSERRSELGQASLPGQGA